MNQEMEGRFYRVEYWSDDCPKHPRGSQIMWHVSMAGAIAESAESMTSNKAKLAAHPTSTKAVG